MGHQSLTVLVLSRGSVTQEKNILLNNMKVFVALCVLLPLAMAAADADAEAKADAEPGYGRHFGHRRYGWGGKRGYGYHGKSHARSYTHVHRPRPVQQCRTVYDTTYEKVCKTIHNKVCELVPTTKYRTEVDQVCHNVPEKVCVPTSQTITEQACSTRTEPACTTEQVCHPEQVCTTEVHTEVDTIVNQECQDIQHQVCQETRVAQHTELVGVEQHANIIGHQVAAAPAVVGAVAGPGLGGVVGAGVVDARFLRAQAQFAGALPAPGAFALGAAPVAGLPEHVIAKRESDPESEAEADSEARDGKSLLLSRLGAGPVVGPAPVAVGPVVGPAPVAVGPPACHVEVQRQCRDVPVQVPRTVQVPKCVPVPKPHCVPTTKVVAGPPACHDEPRQVCNPVSRQVPFEVPVEKCTPVPEQICKEVPHKSARQVCKTAYHGHYGYGHGYGYGKHH